MIDKPGIETLRKKLDKYIETSNLSDVDVLRIFESEMNKRDSYLSTKNLTS